MPAYSLRQILLSIANKRGERRLIMDNGPLGGISSKAVYLLIISLPFVEYGILFNSYVYGKLGIATAIIGYIIFLSTSMMLVFLLVWINNHKLIKKINESWTYYFPTVDIKMVIGSGHTPYRRFFEYYSQKVNNTISDEELHRHLISSITAMEEENKDLIVAMERSKR